jgi:diadenosine tetraphosphate (Ap4A) HIT family hydrolase
VVVERNSMDGREFCTFCWAIESGDPGNTAEYQSLFAPTPAPCRVIQREAAWSAFVALGPIAPGNLLIVPDRHNVCLAELSDSDLMNIEDATIRLSSELQEWDEDVVWFEHGGDPTCEPNVACIEHVHLQIVPIRLGVLEAVSRELGQGVRVEGLRSLNSEREIGKYLFVHSVSEERSMIFRNSELESQYMRRLLFRVIGEPSSWNWRREGRKDTILETMRRFEKFKRSE